MALTAVGEGGLSVVATYDARVDVVKCARWRDGALLAATGNAGRVALIDSRSADVSLALEGTHGRCGYCVRWSPSEEHTLLSVGPEEMLVHDVRYPASARLTLVGHASDRRSTRIWTPAFTHGGRGISAMGAGSQSLTVFRLDDGAVVSQGDLDGKVAASSGGGLLCVPPDADAPEILLMTSGKTLESMVPLVGPADAGMHEG